MLPNIHHVAIIMDGNGRWANLRSHARVWGHIRGASIVTDIVEEADDLGLKALTLFAFSTENWSRPKSEVSSLFKLLKKFLIKERTKILKNNIRFKVMGDISGLPQETKDLILNLENDSSSNSGLKLSFAFGYGGRAEIIHAFNHFQSLNPGKKLTEKELEKYLLVNDIGDVDLLIRTGGEQRISNFLLWQLAYSELFFTDTKWPEFTRKEFREIIQSVAKRERRFGFISQSNDLAESSNKAQSNKHSFMDNLGQL